MFGERGQNDSDDYESCYCVSQLVYNMVLNISFLFLIYLNALL